MLAIFIPLSGTTISYLTGSLKIDPYAIMASSLDTNFTRGLLNGNYEEIQLDVAHAITLQVKAPVYSEVIHLMDSGVMSWQRSREQAFDVGPSLELIVSVTR